MRVSLSAGAQRDLIEIGDFIALDNRERARTFAIELRDASMALAQFPEHHPVVFNQKGVQIRCRTYGRYLIYYKADLEVVQILRVIHSAKDQENMFL